MGKTSRRRSIDRDLHEFADRLGRRSKSSSYRNDDSDAHGIVSSAEASCLSQSRKELDQKELVKKDLDRRGLQVKRTPVGRGLFATKRFSACQIIGEIEGTVLDKATEEGSFYAFDLENGMLLEPSAPFRFVNHSCEPNCHFDFHDGLQRIDQEIPSRRILLLATRGIDAGEELTIDYAWHWNHAIPCRCKSDRCRQWIVAKSQLQQCIEAQNELATQQRLAVQSDQAIGDDSTIKA